MGPQNGGRYSEVVVSSGLTLFEKIETAVVMGSEIHLKQFVPISCKNLPNKNDLKSFVNMAHIA